MGDLTNNLSRHEFECECGCGFDTVDYALVKMLQDSVDYFEDKYKTRVSIVITGGNRCYNNNEETQKKYNPNYVDGSSNSTHIEAKAADHKHYKYINGTKVQINPKEVYEYYDKLYPNNIGLGLYSNRIHVDSRDTKARW